MRENKLYRTREVINIIHDYASIFNTDAGQRVFRDMELSFDGELYIKEDPYGTHMKIGERNVVLRIRRMLEMAEMELIEIPEGQEQEAWNE